MWYPVSFNRYHPIREYWEQQKQHQQQHLGIVIVIACTGGCSASIFVKLQLKKAREMVMTKVKVMEAMNPDMDASLRIHSSYIIALEDMHFIALRA